MIMSDELASDPSVPRPDEQRLHGTFTEPAGLIRAGGGQIRLLCDKEVGALCRGA